MDRSSNAESVVPVSFHRTSWESSAACRGSESVSFVPPLAPETKHERRERESTAKRICADCPVSRECLDYAMRVNEPFGIWGGLTEAERRQLGNTA
jgi:WhiB family transcriptional regulator, redox-sensing transcriptional regulator